MTQLFYNLNLKICQIQDKGLKICAIKLFIVRHLIFFGKIRVNYDI